MVKATEVTAGQAESNGSLAPDGWLKVTCGLTACTPGSAPDPTLGNEYGRTLPFSILTLGSAGRFAGGQPEHHTIAHVVFINCHQRRCRPAVQPPPARQHCCCCCCWPGPPVQTTSSPRPDNYADIRRRSTPGPGRTDRRTRPARRPDTQETIGHSAAIFRPVSSFSCAERRRTAHASTGTDRFRSPHPSPTQIPRSIAGKPIFVSK